MMVCSFLIFDRDETPQGLPLRMLIDNIQVYAGAQGQFHLRRAQGYGLWIGSWNAQLDNADEVAVSAAELLKTSDGNEEWFYDLDAVYVTPSATVRFGVHDSTALFVAAPAPLALQIIANFRNVQSVEPAKF